MASGDAQDFRNRLYSLLPVGWFPDITKDVNAAPALASILAAMSSPLSALYAMLQEVNAATRLATSAGVILDMAALDFFGEGGLPRKTNESDQDYLARIQQALIAPKNTRAAILNSLAALNIKNAVLIEAGNAQDCGTYGPNPPKPVGYGQPGVYYSGRPGQAFFEGICDNDTATQAAIALRATKAFGVLFWIRLLDSDVLQTDGAGDYV